MPTTYKFSAICDPSLPYIDGKVLKRVYDRLRNYAMAVGDVTILNPGVAVEMPFSGPRRRDLLKVIREELSDEPIDLNIVVPVSQRKSMLMADMDSTIIVGESLDDLAAFAGLKHKVAEITEQAMRGEIGFEKALKERVRMLKGLPLSKIDELLARTRLNHGAETLVKTMAKNGAYCALVSGGFSLVTSVIRERLGFHEDRSNVLMHEEGKLTGWVHEPILGKEAKRDAAEELAIRLKITSDMVAAVGDGANDIPMLKYAGIGVAFYGKPKVQEEAPQRINHCDLTGLLYLQGYSVNEFVT